MINLTGECFSSSWATTDNERCSRDLLYDIRDAIEDKSWKLTGGGLGVDHFVLQLYAAWTRNP